jgi:hypothetical protein
LTSNSSMPDWFLNKNEINNKMYRVSAGAQVVLRGRSGHTMAPRASRALSSPIRSQTLSHICLPL